MVLVAIVPGPGHVKKINAFLKPFLEELSKYGPESKGFSCTDSSKPKYDPQRLFQFKLMILNVLGDYPGIAQLKFAADHKSLCGCIKCKANLFQTICMYNYDCHCGRYGHGDTFPDEQKRVSINPSRRNSY